MIGRRLPGKLSTLVPINAKPNAKNRFTCQAETYFETENGDKFFSPYLVFPFLNVKITVSTK
jgi:hypothetical protein